MSSHSDIGKILATKTPAEIEALRQKAKEQYKLSISEGKYPPCPTVGLFNEQCAIAAKEMGKGGRRRKSRKSRKTLRRKTRKYR